MDGVEYVQETKTRYDMIIIDAFSGFTIPPQLIDENAIRQYKRRLSSKGVVALNFISEYRERKHDLAHDLVSRFSGTFREVTVYQADPDYLSGEQQNHLLVAGQKLPHFDYLQSDELTLLD